MVQVSIRQLGEGDLLLEDVITQHGNVLFFKGTTLAERDIEILQAFMITEVAVEKAAVVSRKSDQQIESGQEAGIVQRPAANRLFQYRYEQLIDLLRRVFKNDTGDKLPLIDLRTHLELLVPLFDQQDLLTYTPSSMKKEDYLYHKSIIVALTSYHLASWSSIQQKDLISVAIAGLLHDIGNAGIAPEILNKPGQLSPEELEAVKKHTIIGYNRLKKVEGIHEGVKMAALQHHERVDGSGYPLGVSGSNIHIYARIVAIADIFYAMSRSREYKQASSPYQVLDQLVQDSFGKLDPGLVQTFVYKITQHQLGYTVRLSDGSVGKIVYSERNNPTRPWVDINGTIVNLAKDRQLHVAEIVSRTVS